MSWREGAAPAKAWGHKTENRLRGKAAMRRVAGNASEGECQEITLERNMGLRCSMGLTSHKR